MPAGAPKSVRPPASLVELFDREHSSLPGSKLDLLRSRAFERFVAKGVPTPQDELWKYTNLKRIATTDWRRPRSLSVGATQIAPWIAGGPAARRLIFANGRHDPRASHVRGLPEGVVVRSLGEAFREDPDAVFAAFDQTEGESAFAQLNTALVEDGAWIEVPAGVALEEPIQLIFFHSAGPAAEILAPRVLIALGEGASAHVIEHHVGLSDGAALIAEVSQIKISRGAALRLDRFQKLGAEASSIDKQLVELGEDARFEQATAALGGRILRNESEVSLNGERADAKLAGFFVPRKDEHVDTMIRMHHRAAHGTSDQLFKGVLDHAGRGVFQGKVIVHEGAQKTNAYQTNNNLLLSDDAEIDSKPELEIYADDVKCSHGATIGDLDEREIFYLRSRGIDREAAQAILTYAFVGEALERFGDAEVKRQAQKAVIERLGGRGLEGLMEDAA